MSVLASLKPASNEAQTAPFFASVTDAATRAVVAAAAGDFGWSGDHVIAGGIDQAIEHLSIAICTLYKIKSELICQAV